MYPRIFLKNCILTRSFVCLFVYRFSLWVICCFVQYIAWTSVPDYLSSSIRSALSKWNAKLKIELLFNLIAAFVKTSSFMDKVWNEHIWLDQLICENSLMYPQLVEQKRTFCLSGFILMMFITGLLPEALCPIVSHLLPPATVCKPASLSVQAWHRNA